jgi:uncharacterized RDD family membrane protein YckC
VSQPPGAPRGIVTPEAVLLEFETAGIGSRGLGLVIDFAVQLGLFFLFTLMLGAFNGTGVSLPTWLGIVIVTVGAFLVFFGYPIGMETLWNGRTLGKAAMGLRVVTKEGAPIRFRHASIRGILAIFDFYVPTPGLGAVLSVLFTPRNQRLGDLAAGTIVLRERSATKDVVAVVFPPPYGYEGYVASLDAGALDAEQYGLIRSFLLRVVDFRPAARAALALRLARPVALALHHRPPPTVGPEVFLVCVAAAYQRRYGGAPATAPWLPASTPAPLPPPPPPPPPAPPSLPGGGPFAPPT